jgi:hypothetical protein
MTMLVRRILVTAGIAVLLALAALAVSRPVATTGAPIAAAAAALATTEPVSGSSDPEVALELDAILAADTPAVASDRATARGELRRLAAWRRLVHATVVVDLPKGGLTTVQLDHGTISAVGATSLTIAEAGGATATVTLGDETHVRRAGVRAAVAALETGDEVFVMSRVETTGTTAYLVVVPRR